MFTTLERQELARRVETVGTAVNQLREHLLTERAPFLAGLVRSAEEALVIVYNQLTDLTIPEENL